MPASPKPLPGFLARQIRKADTARALRTAYALVDTRDDFRCWVTHQTLVRASHDPWRVLTHHHLEARSQAKLRRHDTGNIVVLSLAVHRLVTAGALWLLTRAGEKALSVRQLHHAAWNRERVPWGTEPFTLPGTGATRRVM